MTMAMAFGWWMVCLLLLFHFGSSQIYPGSYELSVPAVSESGSSETGHCSNVSDSGRVCNAPRSSVLFDGIPTLTGLKGDMWASQLLTLNTSISSASITFDFTNPTDRNGPTNYAGVSVIEVVMFNCPARGIGAGSIAVNVGDISFDNIVVSESCQYLVRACSNEVSTLTREVTLNFMNQLQHVYLADVTFYTTSRPCSPIGPINTSVITAPATTVVAEIPATTPDASGEISSSPVSSQSQPPMMVSSSGTSVTVMTGSPVSSSNAGVVAAVIIVVLLVIITTVVVCTIVFLVLYKRGKNMYPIRTDQFEKMGESYNATIQHEELEVTAPNAEDHKPSNKENQNLMPNIYSAAYEDMESAPNEKHSKKINVKCSSEYEDIDLPSQLNQDSMNSDKSENKVLPPDSNRYSKLSNFRQRGHTLPQPSPPDSTCAHLDSSTMDSNIDIKTRSRSSTTVPTYAVVDLKSKSGKRQDAGATRGELSTDKMSDSGLPPQRPPRRRTQKQTSEASHKEIPPPVPEKSEELEIELSSEGIPLKCDSIPIQGSETTNPYEDMEAAALDTDDHKASHKHGNQIVMPSTEYEDVDFAPLQKISRSANDKHIVEYEEMNGLPFQTKQDSVESGRSDNEVPRTDSNVYNKDKRRHTHNPTYSHLDFSTRDYPTLPEKSKDLEKDTSGNPRKSQPSVNNNLSLDGNGKAHGECCVPEEDLQPDP